MSGTGSRTGRENLVAPWKPGESGNPDGGRKGKRRPATLRRAVGKVLARQIPHAVLVEVNEALPEGFVIADDADFETLADLIAARVVIAALTGPVDEMLACVSLIKGLEPQERGGDEPEPVVIELTPRRIKKVAQALEEAGVIKPPPEAPND